MENINNLAYHVTVKAVGRLFRATSSVYENISAVAYDIMDAVEDCQRKIKLHRAEMELTLIREANRKGRYNHAR